MYVLAAAAAAAAPPVPLGPPPVGVAVENQALVSSLLTRQASSPVVRLLMRI
eukprot:COSAG06_NODE_59632_length_273_cov_1.172414_1_plen_51_part_01